MLREFVDDDVRLAVEFGTDPYIPLIGSLPAYPTADQALEWVRPQRGRLAEGSGYSLAIAESANGRAVGAIGLWLRDLPAVHRVELYVEPWNTSSIRVARAAGYEQEGLLRSYLEIGGGRRDMLIYAILRPLNTRSNG